MIFSLHIYYIFYNYPSYWLFSHFFLSFFSFLSSLESFYWHLSRITDSFWDIFSLMSPSKAFFISTTVFLILHFLSFFHRISIFLLILSIYSYTISIFKLELVSILFIVILNALSDNSKIFDIPESSYDSCFISPTMFCFSACFVTFC